MTRHKNSPLPQKGNGKSSKTPKQVANLDIDNFLGNKQLATVFKKYAHLQITETTQIPPPVVVIKISNQIISSEGNVTTVSGAPKSGKSAFCSILIAGAIAPGKYDDLPEMDVTPANGKAVIHFDTEQARHNHQKNLKTILKRAHLNTCPENFLSYNIRAEEIENYITTTSEITEAAYQKFKGVHLLVIDGGADYIPDVNDQQRSNELVKHFEGLAMKFKAALIIIVHLNPGGNNIGGNKERGHFGSQLQRKSESVLTIQRQDDSSYIEPKLLRNAGNGDIPRIQFAYDKSKGYHVYCGIKPPKAKDEKNLNRVPELKDLARKVFAPPTALSYKEALQKIQEKTGKQIATAKLRFKVMKDRKMIIQGENKRWLFNVKLR